MTATLIDGRVLSAMIERGMTNEVDAMRSRGERVPGLGVIIVGENPASEAYVKNKTRCAQRIGFETIDIHLAKDATTEEVATSIENLARNRNIDGILLQLPLPSHLPTKELLNAIPPEKDADGLHPLNQGLLFKGAEFAAPCTPSGVIKLIDWAKAGCPDEIDNLPQTSLAQLHAVVVGRSLLVGKPLITKLLERDATVTIAHSKTANLANICHEADILIGAAGSPQLIKSEFVKTGAIVIDVGINRLSSGELVGDVDFDQVISKASFITPVPGGVGPMTVVMLMANTLKLRKISES